MLRIALLPAPNVANNGTLLEHYKTVAVIDTGTYNVPAVAAEVRPFAEALDLSVSIIPGDLRLFDALLAGEWNQDEFLVVPPGDTITLNDSLTVGNFQGER